MATREDTRYLWFLTSRTHGTRETLFRRREIADAWHWYYNRRARLDGEQSPLYEVRWAEYPPSTEAWDELPPDLWLYRARTPDGGEVDEPRRWTRVQRFTYHARAGDVGAGTGSESGWSLQHTPEGGWWRGAAPTDLKHALELLPVEQHARAHELEASIPLGITPIELSWLAWIATDPDQPARNADELVEAVERDLRAGEDYFWRAEMTPPDFNERYGFMVRTLPRRLRALDAQQRARLGELIKAALPHADGANVSEAPLRTPPRWGRSGQRTGWPLPPPR